MSNCREKSEVILKMGIFSFLVFNVAVSAVKDKVPSLFFIIKFYVFTVVLAVVIKLSLFLDSG